MALKAVIFDFGGVFTTSPVSNFGVYERARGLPERFISGVIRSNLDGGAFSRFERAELTAEEFDEAFAAETRAAGHEVRGGELAKMMKLEFRPPMIEAHKRICEAGLKTGCITNNMPASSAKDWARDGAERNWAAEIMSRFDHVIESSKAGVSKPDPRIYEMMLETLGIAPGEAIYVDDLGVNLKPAVAMGMDVVKVPFEGYEIAIEELAQKTGLILT
ncbi:MAG: HAD-IA family hydrolase [Paracoccaceae bacterium]|nr:HAD-IA family hydrolase [Paracoccaceae bacterium]MDG1371112.1 HAD-IA family hydrolase [Paracoccaceae bacterium]